MKQVAIGWIIVLVIVFALLLAIWILFKKITRKVENFSRMAFGTSDIRKGVEQIQKEYAATPKSVSGMTSLYLPKIAADFPEFKYDEMKSKAVNVLCSFLLAVDRMNSGKLEDANEELQNQLENRILNLKGSSKREHFKEIKVHQTEINNYRKTEGRCIITFQSSTQYYHYIEDEEGKLLSGSRDVLFQSKYNVDLIYIQDRNIVENELDYALGLNCPNCGAPISSLGAKVCEYCGTPVIEISIHAWSFSSITEKV